MDDDTRKEIAKLKAEIEQLKICRDFQDRQNKFLLAHINKATEHLAAAIDKTNDWVRGVIACVDGLTDDVQRDGWFALNRLTEHDIALKAIKEVVMPEVAEFDEQVTKVIGLPEYWTHEQGRKTSS